MEGKRRQKGERLIITKKRVESTSKGGGGGGLVFKREAKVQNKRQKFLRTEIQKQER